MLSVANPEEITIPAGTEVATVRTESQEAIIFTVDEDLTITPPQMEYFLVSSDGLRYDDRLPLLREWESLAAQGVRPTGADRSANFPLFQSVPQTGNSFYLGYNTNLRSTVLSITLNCDEAAGTGINPANPPLLWEYWDAVDGGLGTLGAPLGQSGVAGIRWNQRPQHIRPDNHAYTPDRLAVELWTRGRDSGFVAPSPRPPSSKVSTTRRRHYEGTVSESIGGTMVASNAIWVKGELLGASDGKAGPRRCGFLNCPCCHWLWTKP